MKKSAFFYCLPVDIPDFMLYSVYIRMKEKEKK